MGDPYTFDKRPGEPLTNPTASGPGTTIDPDVTFYQPRALLPGEIIGHYRIEAPLGQGGNGTAYAARNIDDEEERVAIKLIRPDRRDRARLARMLRAEAAALRRVKHDAIVQYRTFKRIPDSDEYYLVTEHVEGPALSTRLTGAPMNPVDVCRLAVRVADALETAHAQGVIHRDLSPDNIIMPDDDPSRATLIDFGIAKQGTVDPLGVDFVGKLAYAAPEQFEGDPSQIGPWTDLYSLGLVLAAAARGRRLNMGRDIEGAVEARRHEPDLGDIPLSLRRPISALLKPDPAARIRNAGAVAALFGEEETLLADGANQTVVAGHDWHASLTRKPPKRTPLMQAVRFGIGAAIVSIAIFVLAATGLGLWRTISTWNDLPPGGEAPAGGDPGQSAAPAPEKPPVPQALSPRVAQASALGRRAAALARIAETQGLMMEKLADAATVSIEKAATEGIAAAARGKAAADEACLHPGPGRACKTGADGAREAGEQSCAGDACVWSGYVSFTEANGARFDGLVDYGRYRLGELTTEDGSVYDGAFDSGGPSGPGRMVQRDKTVLTGTFGNGKLQGVGRITFGETDPSERTTYSGLMRDDMREGPGIQRWKSGDAMSGNYAHDSLTGYAVEASSRSRTEASYSDWFAEIGITYFPDGRRYEGSYGTRLVNDTSVQVQSGYGVMYAPDGTVEAQGLWHDDQIVTPSP